MGHPITGKEQLQASGRRQARNNTRGGGSAGACRMLVVILGIGLLLAPATHAREFTAGEHEFSFGGFANIGNAIRLSDPGSYFISQTELESEAILLQQNQLRLELSGAHPGDVYTLLNIDTIVTSAPEHPFDDAAEFEIDEAYIDFRAKEVDWRIGKEKVIWGKADLISPFDVMTARDVKDPFVNSTIQDRIGQWGVRATYVWDDFSLEAAYYPVWSRSKSPDAETDVDANGSVGDTRADAWFPPVGIFPTFGLWTGDPTFPFFVFLTTYNQTEYPDRNAKTGTLAAKFNAIQGNWDTDIYFVSTIDPLPHPELTALFVQTQYEIDGQLVPTLQLEVDGHIEHTRINTFGAATATTWGRLAFRSEIAFTSGLFWYRLFDEAQMQDLLNEFNAFGISELRNTTQEHSSFKAIIGGDIEIPNTGIFTSNQVSFTKGFDHLDVYFQDALEVNMSNMVRKSWIDDHLTFSWVDLVNFTGNSIWMRPGVSYTLPNYEDLQLSAGISIFTGEDFSFVGQYGDHSALVLSGRLYF